MTFMSIMSECKLPFTTVCVAVYTVFSVILQIYFVLGKKVVGSSTNDIIVQIRSFLCTVPKFVFFPPWKVFSIFSVV